MSRTGSDGTKPSGRARRATDAAATNTDAVGADKTLITPAGGVPGPADPSALRVGELAFGRYRIERELGRGGMGAVYLGEDTQLDRKVALKIPSAAAAADSALAERFLREAKAAATLRHPHLCPVYDAGEWVAPDGTQRLFLTMAYLPGKTLREAVRGPQPVRSSVRLIATLADAMAHAHDRGVIHRDLKPANVLLDEAGKPYVADFGLARRVSEESRVTQSGASLGTPAYMSPEQIAGDPARVGPRSDVYSLGVMLYELLAGRLPFEGSASAVMVKAYNEDPRPPGEVRAETQPDAGPVPPALEAIWRRMVARDPAKRFESMHAVRDALANFLRKTPRSDRAAAAPAPTASSESAAALARDSFSDLGSLPGPDTVLERRRQARKQGGRAAAAKRVRDWALPAGVSLTAVALSGALAFALFGGADADPAVAELAPARAAATTVAATPMRVRAEIPPPRVLTGHEGEVKGVALTPDGNQLVSGSLDGTVRVWDLTTGRQLQAIKVSGAGLQGVAVTPDGKFAIIPVPWTQRIWELNLSTGQVERMAGQSEGAAIMSIATTPNGRQFLTGMQDGSVWNWDRRTLLPTRKFEGYTSPETGTHVRDLGVAPDGLTAVSAHNDAIVRVLDLEAGTVRRTLAEEAKRTAHVLAVAVSPDGQRIAGSCTNGLWIWQLSSGQAERSLHVHEGGVADVAFTPDGRWLVSGGHDQTVRITELATSRLIATLTGHTDRVLSIAVTPDGRRVVSGSEDGTVRIWDVFEPDPEASGD